MVLLQFAVCGQQSSLLLLLLLLKLGCSLMLIRSQYFYNREDLKWLFFNEVNVCGKILIFRC